MFVKVLVTGASGLLGHKIVKELMSGDYDIIAIYNKSRPVVEGGNVRWVQLDLVNTHLVEDLILKERPDVVVHAAAYTDVDGCEVNREYAWRVNVEATRSIVRASRVVRAFLIYVSTDYVFDGEKGLYKESDVPCPVNYYGLTKLIGEQLVITSDLLYTVVRTSAIYGVGPGKLNFATFVVDRLSKGESIFALVDQYVSPTLNTLLAKAIAEIMELKPMGILHVAGERMNRYDFAVRVADLFGLPKELIKEGRMKDMTHWKARRPRDSSLDVSKARSLLKTPFYDVNLSLKLFAEEYNRLGSG